MSRTCFGDCVKEVFFYTVFFHIVKEKNKEDDINNIFVAVLSNMEVLAFVRISLKKTEKSEKIC